MQLGVKPPATNLIYVHQILNRTAMYEEAKSQVQKGLDCYKAKRGTLRARKSRGSQWILERQSGVR